MGSRSVAACRDATAPAAGEPVLTEYLRVEVPGDEDALVAFLCSDVWPFHGRPVLTGIDVRGIDFASSDVNSWWIVDGGQRVGLIRVFDLDDIGEGAPRFDLRIAGAHRGCGHGGRAACWLVRHLFAAYPQLHRIEANTRDDNAAMQRALSSAGFTFEGRLRESWPAADAQWFDTLIYGILRSES